MSTVKVQPLASAHLDAPGAVTWTQQKQTPPVSPPHEPWTHADDTTLSYSFDQTQQSLRIVVTDKTTGAVLRNIEFRSFHADLHRTEKLSGLLLDQQA